jgi:hypothetical protein
MISKRVKNENWHIGQSKDCRKRRICGSNWDVIRQMALAIVTRTHHCWDGRRELSVHRNMDRIGSFN